MRKSIAAGALIAMASYLYLKATAPLGAIFFGFALSFIIVYKLDLFTGKIGMFGEKKLPYMQILAGNLIGALTVCLLLGVNANISQAAAELAAIKAALPWYTALINGVFCGVLMYLAVSSWNRGFHAGCFLSVTVFILCGFEHSIADFAYMAYAWTWSVNLLWILLGNAIGAVLCRLAVEERAVFFSILPLRPRRTVPARGSEDDEITAGADQKADPEAA